MNKNVLDNEVYRLLLGELSETEAANLREQLKAEDGNLDRIDRLKKGDDAFLDRFPPQVFAAQVESKLGKGSEAVNISKPINKKRGHRMVGKRILLVVAAVAVTGAYVNHLNTSSEKNVESVSSKHVEKITTKDFETDFAKIKKYIQKDAAPSDEELRLFSGFLADYDVNKDPDRMLWVASNYATLLDNGGHSNLPSAASVRTKIANDFRQLSNQEKANLNMSKQGVAKSLFMDSEKDFLKFTSIILSSSDEAILKNQLVEKRALSKVIEKKLDEVIGLDVPRWSVAAHYRSAAMSVDSAEAVRRSYIPPRLTPSQVLKYRQVLEKAAMKIELSALDALQKGLALKTSDIQYLSESRILLAQLKIKLCPNQTEVDVLNSVINEIRRGSIKKAEQNIQSVDIKSEIHFPELVEIKTRLSDNIFQEDLNADAEKLETKLENWICGTQTIEKVARNHSVQDKKSDMKAKLTRIDIRETIENARSKFRKCADRSNASNFSGEINVSFLIAKSGQVWEGNVQPSLREKDIGRCIHDVMLTLRFPKSESEQRVSYPVFVAKTTSEKNE